MGIAGVDRILAWAECAAARRREHRGAGLSSGGCAAGGMVAAAFASVRACVVVSRPPGRGCLSRFVRYAKPDKPVAPAGVRLRLRRRQSWPGQPDFAADCQPRAPRSFGRGARTHGHRSDGVGAFSASRPCFAPPWLGQPAGRERQMPDRTVFGPGPVHSSSLRPARDTHRRLSCRGCSGWLGHGIPARVHFFRPRTAPRFLQLAFFPAAARLGISPCSSTRCWLSRRWW